MLNDALFLGWPGILPLAALKWAIFLNEGVLLLKWWATNHCKQLMHDSAEKRLFYSDTAVAPIWIWTDRDVANLCGINTMRVESGQFY
jgi:hypothetical protein